MKNLKIEKLIKKHKGVRRDTPGMTFESYAMRINMHRDIDCKREEKKNTVSKYKHDNDKC